MTCEFNDLKDSLIRDIFICNMDKRYSKIRQKLLAENNIELEKVINIYKAMEVSHTNNNYLEEPQISTLQYRSRQLNHTPRSSYMKSSRSNSRSQSKHNKQDICTRCGQVHRYKCPAYGKTCNKCKKTGHFAHMCRTPVQKTIEVNNLNDSLNTSTGNLYSVSTDLSNQELFIGSLQSNKLSTNNVNSNNWIIDIQINKQNISF